jgi:hypothetical protein
MDENATIVPIGHNLILVADALVESRNMTGLNALSAIISDLIVVADVVDNEISIMEVGEYADEALDLFSKGKSVAEVKASSIRELLNTQ